MLVVAFGTSESTNGDGLGNLLLAAILVIAVLGAIACMFLAFPILVAIRHGIRWSLAVFGGTILAGIPLNAMFEADEPQDSWWGLLSFPFWIVVSIIAWRGPPSWFPTKDRGAPRA